MLIALQLIGTPQGVADDEPAREFSETQVTIGRAPNCHVVLPDGLRIISRQHARLTFSKGDVLLTCLSASAPVLVNALQVSHGGALPVRDGDIIHIGGFELRLTTPADAASARAADEVEPVTSPQALLPLPLAEDLTPGSLAVGMPRGRARLDEWFDLEPVAPSADQGSELRVVRTTPSHVDFDLRSSARTNGDAASPSIAPGAGTLQPEASGAEQRVFASLHEVLQARGSVPPMAPAERVEAPQQEVAAAPAEVQPQTDETLHALMLAFLDGAGMAPRAGTTTTQTLAPMALTPAWMHHLGELLRASVEGVLALLHSRAVVKREMRAEVTVISRRQNNPLKFAPDALAALAHLVGARRSSGFLAPVAAVKDAHEDLLVHHLAVVAGMRAAMFELIARLGPDDILREEGPAKGLSAALPTVQEAALWRRYRQRHAEMTASLDDHFETVFGREFTKAYEAQARQVREQAPPTDPTV